MRTALRGVPASTVVLVLVVAVAAALGAWRASSVEPLGPTLDGPCQLSARLEPGGVLIDPSRSGGVYAVPASADLVYQAELTPAPGAAAASDPGRRRLVGRVVLDLPPLLGDVTLARWDEFGSLPSNRGSRTYSLPRRWAPIGLGLRVVAEHTEPGLRCTGSLSLRLDGPALGTWLRPLAVGLLVACAWLVARAARPPPRRHDPWLGRRIGPGRWSPVGRPGLGAVAGLLYGLSSTIVLLLSSAVALQSVWVLLVPLIGVAIGVFLGWRGPGAGQPDEDAGTEAAERELALLDPLGEVPAPAWSGSGAPGSPPDRVPATRLTTRTPPATPQGTDPAPPAP